MTNPSEPNRFDRHTRALHWANASVVLVLMATGASMYITPIGNAIGNRDVVKYAHIAAGLLFPIVLLIGFLGRDARQLRIEARTLSRWQPGDGAWLASFGRRGNDMGKYNAGQKLNSAVIAGCLSVLLITGLIIVEYAPFSDTTRTSATFTHDVFALISWVLVAGHIVMAFAHPASLRAMIRGR
ncbi:MAG: cytochrome b/b6 domain-containing protein [Acidimicrobiia bacterium]